MTDTGNSYRTVFPDSVSWRPVPLDAHEKSPTDALEHRLQQMTAEEVNEVLYWALVFFLIALVAAVFGFGGIAAASAGIAKILFFIFLVLFLVSLVSGLVRRPRTPRI